MLAVDCALFVRKVNNLAAAGVGVSVGLISMEMMRDGAIRCGPPRQRWPLSGRPSSVSASFPKHTGDAIEDVKPRWQRPMGAYPESGCLTMPEWKWVDFSDPASRVERARRWRCQGVTAFGGCCGLGPHHIAALARQFDPE